MTVAVDKLRPWRNLDSSYELIRVVNILEPKNIVQPAIQYKLYNEVQYIFDDNVGTDSGLDIVSV